MNTELERYRSDALGWKAEAERWREIADSATAELAKAREAMQLLADTVRELNDIVNPKS
jgi:transglutaminase-like putative cysteine protease